MQYQLEIGGQEFNVHVEEQKPGTLRVSVNGAPYDVMIRQAEAPAIQSCVSAEKPSHRPTMLGTPMPPHRCPLSRIPFEAAGKIPEEDPQYYLNLPTSFKPSKEQVARLVSIGPVCCGRRISTSVCSKCWPPRTRACPGWRNAPWDRGSFNSRRLSANGRLPICRSLATNPPEPAIPGHSGT